MECQECEGEFLLNSGSGEEEEGLSSLVVSR